MEPAFGHDFSRVRVHSDAQAANLSAGLNARAFTIGNDVAFGAGEYRPGTLVGDALIAHELAHVVQQRGGVGYSVPSQKGLEDSGVLEREADDAAAGAIVSTWGGDKSGRAVSRLAREGLRLQRCGSATKQVVTDPKAAAFQTAGAPPECPPSLAYQMTPPTDPKVTPNPKDERAKAIMSAAKDESRPFKDRAMAAVRSILHTYYPKDEAMISNVVYVPGEPGLLTENVGQGASATGSIEVGDQFVRSVGLNSEFPRSVLRVGHELQHVDQFRAGMTGSKNKNEREFLAYYCGALAVEIQATGRMHHATRVDLIDQALGYYYCLTDELQAKYSTHRDRLLDRRKVENTAGGNQGTQEPTSCKPQPER
jgi:hypothetical protein